jgi:hypothetical protein
MLTKERLQAEWDIMTPSNRDSLLSFVANVRPDFDFGPRLDPFRTITTDDWCEAAVPGLGLFRYHPQAVDFTRSPILEHPFTSEEQHLYALLLGSKICLFMGTEDPPPPVRREDPPLTDGFELDLGDP